MLRHRRQLNDYYCGPAVLQIALAAVGKRLTQKKAAELLGTTKQDGTSIAALVGTLQSFGLSVDAAEGRTIDDLRAALRQNKIIIACFTERHYEWGHYAIVVGFEGDHIRFLDPAEPLGREHPMTVDEFERRWQDPLHTKTDHWAAFIARP